MKIENLLDDDILSLMTIDFNIKALENLIEHQIKNENICGKLADLRNNFMMLQTACVEKYTGLSIDEIENYIFYYGSHTLVYNVKEKINDSNN